MENQTGKRVQQAGKPSGRGKGPKIAAIAAAAVVVILAGGYLGLCALAGGSGRVYPNTTILGVDVSGMSAGEAAQAVEQGLSQQLAEDTLTITDQGSGHTASLSCDIVAAEDVDAAVAQVISNDGFLAGGYQYLRQMVTPTQVTPTLTLTSEGKQALKQAREKLTADLADPMVDSTCQVVDTNLVITKGTSGTGIDEAALEADVLSAITQMLDEGGSSADVPVTLTQVDPAEPDFEALYQQVYTEPVDAYLDKNTKSIVPGVVGVSFDIAAVRTQLEQAAEGETLTIPLTYTQPEMTTEKLNANLFKDVLGSGYTTCAGPSNRWYNIDLAAGRLNGIILLPGETFSYNDTVGPYTQSSGYRNAGTYQNGQSIDALAGGICQLSSTLYWVTLKANLETVERHQHGFNGGYMPVVGTDATVWSNVYDFQFKNDTDYPIKIESYLDSSHRVHVTIYGTNTSGIHGEPYSVTISTVPYKNTYKPDSSIPVGSEPRRDPNYSRYNGITVDVYQKLVDANGSTVDTIYLYRNTYRSSDAVYYYNPADAARLGIDTTTGLKTLTPVTSTPAPSPSAAPSATPAPTPSPAATSTPTPAPTPSPTPAQPTPTPAPTPPAAETPAPPPEQTAPATPAASAAATPQAS